MTATCSWTGVAVLCVVPVIACGGEDGGGNGITVVQPDASIDAMEPCKGADTYSPTFAADEQLADDYPATGSGDDATLHNIFFNAPLDADDPGDYLFIDLYEQYGAFDGTDITVGTFAIADDDQNYSTCGACIMVAADATDDYVDDWYMARSGVLNLSSVSGRLTGSISNVRLYRVKTDVNGQPSDALTYDCETVITSASFDVDLTTVTAARGRARRLRPARGPANISRPTN